MATRVTQAIGCEDVTSKRWIAVNESEFGWEREALDYIKAGLPFDREPFRAWANFEFVAEDGSINELDPSPVILWAGHDHPQQAQATAPYTLDRKEQDGWPKDRLLPLLVALHELLPWLLQWHNKHDPDYGMGLGDYFAGFVAEEARSLGLTNQDLDNWTAPEKKKAARKVKAPKVPKVPKAAKAESEKVKRGRRKAGA